MAVIIDKDELFRYLKGEITMQQWKQGQELLELFSGDGSTQQTFQISAGTSSNQDLSVSIQSNVQPSLGAVDESIGQPEYGDGLEEGEEEEEEEEGEEEEGNESEHQQQQLQAREGRQVGAAGTSTDWADNEYLGLKEGPGDDAMDIEMKLEREERRKGRKKKGRKPGIRRNLVPKPLRGLMGEAHLCFARGAYDEAVVMCSEIIKQAPKCPDPFQLLGMIYEDKGEIEKSLQFSLIAAHLNPRDVEEWIKLAETCLDQDNVKQALYCYTKALKYDPQNVSLLWEKANLYDQLQDHKKAMECYHTILKVLPPEKADESLQLARDMVKTCHQGGDIPTAIDIMETTIGKHPDRISSEDVNMLSELHMSIRQFQRALQVISDHCGVTLRSKIDATSMTMSQLKLMESIPTQPGSSSSSSEADDIEVIMAEGIPIDLRVKLGVCLVHCRHLTSAQGVLSELYCESPDDMGDLYLDVAEAYVEVGEYKEAKSILAQLVKTSNYNLPAVWLRYAECLNNLGDLKSASNAYRRVLEHVPTHLDARLTLATIEKQMGNVQTALKVLSLEDESDSDYQGPQNIQIVYQRCMLQHSQGLLKESAETAVAMMTKYLKMTPDDNQSDIDISDDYDISVIRKDDWFNLFVKMCEALIATNQTDKAAKFAIRAIRTNIKNPERQPLTSDAIKKEKLEFLAVCCCFLNGEYTEAFNFIKGFMLRGDGTCIPAWNLFNLITSYTMDTRHHKFCLRLTVRKFPDTFALSVLNGHNAFISGSFKHALGEYVRGYRMETGDPMVHFCIGLCMLHIACQKYSMKKHSLVIQSFAFLKHYQELRGYSQETYYNHGRALNQLNLSHLAVHYYQKALDTAPSIADDSRFDLSREIAYNLAMIYQNSGNHELAGQLLYKYVVV